MHVPGLSRAKRLVGFLAVPFGWLRPRKTGSGAPIGKRDPAGDAPAEFFATIAACPCDAEYSAISVEYDADG
jgi:hypothetical protein